MCLPIYSPPIIRIIMVAVIIGFSKWRAFRPKDDTLHFPQLFCGQQPTNLGCIPVLFQTFNDAKAGLFTPAGLTNADVIGAVLATCAQREEHHALGVNTWVK